MSAQSCIDVGGFDLLIGPSEQKGAWFTKGFFSGDRKIIHILFQNYLHIFVTKENVSVDNV